MRQMARGSELQAVPNPVSSTAKSPVRRGRRQHAPAIQISATADDDETIVNRGLLPRRTGLDLVLFVGELSLAMDADCSEKTIDDLDARRVVIGPASLAPSPAKTTCDATHDVKRALTPLTRSGGGAPSRSSAPTTTQTVGPGAKA